MSEHTPGVMRAAKEIARAISELCAAQGGVVNSAAIAAKTATVIDRETGAPELLTACCAVEAHLDKCALPIEVEESLRDAIAKAKDGHK